MKASRCGKERQERSGRRKQVVGKWSKKWICPSQNKFCGEERQGSKNRQCGLDSNLVLEVFSDRLPLRVFLVDDGELHPLVVPEQ